MPSVSIACSWIYPAMAPATTTVVSTDPKIWVVDDCLPPEFVQMVNSTFDSADGNSQHQKVKKPNSREILARNIDFDAKDELCREVFQRISDLCGISGPVPFKEFMVSEVWASGQDAHVDHVNVDDVGSSKLSFLDLTRQSCSESEPRRVVPTISILVYFNSVGGIRFPFADKTISAKPGRMVLFHNYDDQSRPSHKTSAEHYGIYLETLPRRLLIMGVLANHTPKFKAYPDSKTSEALVYCAGTKRDPLYHDNPSYDVYKTPQQISERIQTDRFVLAEQERERAEKERAHSKPSKPDLILTLDLNFNEKGHCEVEARTMAGDVKCKMYCEGEMLEIPIKHVRGQIERQTGNAHNIVLCFPSGQLLTEEHDHLTVGSFAATAGTSETQADQTDQKSCCRSCSLC